MAAARIVLFFAITLIVSSVYVALHSMIYSGEHREGTGRGMREGRPRQGRRPAEAIIGVIKHAEIDTPKPDPERRRH
jgi:hypothetical protein